MEPQGFGAAGLLETTVRADDTSTRLLRVLKARAAWSETPERASLYDEIATLHIGLEDHGSAFEALKTRLELDPNDGTVWDRLILAAQHCEDRWEATSEALENGIVETEGILQTILSYRFAQVLAERVEEPERAQLVLEELLSDVETAMPEAETLLERVLHQERAWGDLASFYQRQAAKKEDVHAKSVLLEKVARLQEDFVQDGTAAVQAYRALLEVRANDERAIQAVERILQETEEWSELADFWSDATASLEGAPLARMQTRLGELYLNELDEPAMAVGHLELALGAVPRYAAAMAALEGILAVARREESGGMLGAQVATLLEPLYNSDVEWQKLIEVYEVQRSATDAPEEAVAVLSKLGELYAAHDDAAQAFNTFARALHVAPDNDAVCDRLSSLVEASGEWGRLRGLYGGIIDGDISITVASGLRMRIAAIYEAQIDGSDSVGEAVAVYRELLSEDETHIGASEALEALLRSHARWAELAGVLTDRLHILEDQDARLALHVQLAELFEQKLSQPEAAAEEYRHMLSDDPDNVDALDALERLYAASESWDDFVGILAHKVELAETDEARRMVYFQIGEIQAEHLESPLEAIEAFRMVLEVDPTDLSAMNRLVELYERAEEWPELAELLSDMREIAEGPAQVDADLQIGRIRWTHLEDTTGAISALSQALAQDPECEGAITC